ncbi:MAG TPA: glycosyltransferase family 9 protein [Woeseiaceae bacterium]|nr:glycosyltransferase family 9 protein [Woeseiaceae bacterium]
MPTRPPGSAGRFRRILVVAAPAHGDILLATPLLASLRRACPDAVIHVLVYRGQAGILAGNDDVDEVLTASKHPGFGESLGLLRRLLRNYDLAISTKHTDRAVGYAVLAGRWRVASVPPGRHAWKRRLTQAQVLYDHYGTHTIVQNASLAAALGIDCPPDVRLPTAPDAASVVDRLLAGGDAGAPLAVLHLNPGLPHKRWTFAGWAAVAAFLQRRGFRLVLTGDGSRGEAEYLDEATRQVPASVTNLAGQLRFADVTELLRRCRLYVGTDTVTSHLAAAAGVPTVALFGPETPRVWGPWPRGGRYEKTPFPGPGNQRAGNVLVVQSTEPCPTCRQAECLRRSERERSCLLMQNLGSGQVLEAITQML